ncbi:MAG: hypothetical protein IH840_00100 [Candidatus Heimdallarchaeota archaeon]|nr:hypothetical protein [Candidatus Heimdallarchaeota archaeon]
MAGISNAAYDFDEITKFREKHLSWRHIAKYYNVNHPSAFNWYNRKLSNLEATSLETKPKIAHTALEDNYTYGSNPPTLYISELSNEDWVNKYAGGFWETDYLPELQNLIWDTIKGMYQLFRSGGKTFSCVGLFCRWILEKRTEILCFTNPGMKDEIYRNVVDVLLSDEIRADYGDVLVRWTESKGIILCVKELRKGMRFPNFKVIGNTGASVGSHPGGWIHIEDIVQDMAVSDEANRRLERWLGRIVKFMRKQGTKITITGTRKDPFDFYQFAGSIHHFPITKWLAMELVSGRYPTISECTVDHILEKVTDWPQDIGVYKVYKCPEWPLESLLYMYLFHYEDYEAELNNNPLPSKGRFFDGDDFIEFDDLTETGLNYMLVDPAFGLTNYASKTAIMMVNITQGHFDIIDAYIGRLGLDAKADMIVDFHARHRPAQTIIEDNFRQITTRYAPDHSLMKLRGLTLIEQFDPKRQRIEAMKFSFRKREIRIHKDCPFKAEINGEYLSYSQEDSEQIIKTRYNALDALAMGYLRFKHFLINVPYKLRVGAYSNR